MVPDNQPDFHLPEPPLGGIMHPTTAEITAGIIEGPDQLPVTNQQSLSPLRKSLRHFSQDKRAMVSLGILLLLLLLALLGPVIYTHLSGPITNSSGRVLTPDQYRGPFYSDLDHQDETFSALHWLGTDSNGRDLLAR